MNIMDKIDRQQVKKNIPEFAVGDTVKVHTKIVEGDNERVQAFSGVVIAKKHQGIRETFTVRRVSFGQGVERIFPINSPRIDKIEIERKGHVRRAKLYYLRSKIGKSAKVKDQKFVPGSTQAAAPVAAPAAEPAKA
jgi:large subunit ribosomal protein L19